MARRNERREVQGGRGQGRHASEYNPTALK